MESKKSFNIKALWSLISTLRGENGCIWDKKQTPLSMIEHLLNESYELADAIKEQDTEAVCEELGDVLFQLIFIIFLYEGKGLFSFDRVVDKIKEKMIRRHPHVFGSEKIASLEELDKSWKKIKTLEKEPSSSVLAGVVKSQPALKLAMEISSRVADCGFDWDSEEEVWDKVFEELEEFTQALDGKDTSLSSLEFGDLLFSLVNIARFRKIDPESALREMLFKFIRRFNYMEDTLALTKEKPALVKKERLEELWQEAKSLEEI